MQLSKSVSVLSVVIIGLTFVSLVPAATTQASSDDVLSRFRAWLQQKGPPPDVKEAKQLIELSEQHADDGELGFLVAQLLRKGVIPESVPGQGISSLRRAAELQHRPAQALLGLLELTGDEVPEDRQHGRKVLLEALDAGEPYAKYAIGTLLADGSGGFAKDPKKAKLLLSEAAAGGVIQAWAFVGHLALQSGDVDQALKAFEHGASAGDSQAMTILARWLYEGEHIARDRKRALLLMVKASIYEADDADFCRDLALMYRTATWDGDHENNERRWLERASKLGDPKSRYLLVQTFFRPESHAVDTRKGIDILIDLAKNGLAEAQFDLGTMYLAGIGVERNVDIGTSLLVQAARQGHAGAATYVRILTNTGKHD
jgi:TPR repeat protein